jgi:hypothetical protein
LVVRKVSDIQQVLSLLTMGMRPYCHNASLGENSSNCTAESVDSD